MRVLHVVGGLNRGGTESWLSALASVVPRDQLTMEFAVHGEAVGVLEPSLAALGVRVHHLPLHTRPSAYVRTLFELLKAERFDIVHSHVHMFSGLVMLVATAAGVPIRIAHSHSDTSREQASYGFTRCVYAWMMRQMLNRYSTARVAASKVALDALFGEDAHLSKNTYVLYCGIELARFLGPIVDLRGELGLQRDAVLLAHVGRFVAAKNHRGLVALFARYARANRNAHLVLIGDGPLREQTQEYVREQELSSRIHFLGSRDDVAGLLQACDCFIFPSLWEGLPLALLEAQAAGLPAMVSANVTDEADVISELIQRFHLEDPVDQVCYQIGNHIQRRLDVSESLAKLRQSPFSAESSAKALHHLYLELRESTT